MRTRYSSGNSTSTSNGFATDTIFMWGFTYRIPPPRLAQRPSVCPHKLLSLPCSASRMEARSAYRRLAKIAHPDVAPLERREELSRWMVVLNHLYELLEAA